MKKNYKVIIILLLCFIFMISVKLSSVYAKNLSEEMRYMIDNYNATLISPHDVNSDGIMDIEDIVSVSLALGKIDIKNIKDNYVKVISTKDKSQYEELGYKIPSQYCLPVTKEGLDLFAYVNAGEGMRLEILEGDNSFTVQGDRLYLSGLAPAMARVRLINSYAESEEFYVYGTNDRSVHDYTYDYILSLVND